MTEITHLPLGGLRVDDDVNVRKTARGAEPIHVATIRAKGVIEPLKVRPDGAGDFKIIDGGKRHAALLWLREHGDSAAGVPVDDTYPVPAIVREESDAEARDTSLILNIARTGMHPVDAYEAFVHLEADGMSTEDIAAHYGLQVKEVRQRLALGQLSPKIRQAWRAGEIPGEVAMAYTLAPTVKDQERVFAKSKKSEWSWHANQVRNEIRGKKGDMGRLVVFVGLDALRKAGVKVTEDLFGTNHIVADATRVKALADEKIAAECERLVETGWSWAMPADDPSLANSYSWGRIAYNRRGKPKPEQAARLDEIRAEQEKLEGTEGGEQRFDELEAERDTIQTAIDEAAYKKAERARSGCIVSVSHEGWLDIRYGVIRPDQARKEKAKQRKKDAGEAEPATLISNALMQRLSEQLTAATAEAIAMEPTLALAAALAGVGNCGRQPVALSEKGLQTKRNRVYSAGSEFATLFAARREAPVEENLAILGRIVGDAIDMQVFNANASPLADGDNAALCNAIAPETMNAALRKAFDAADYFGAVSKARCLEAITEAVNEDEARKVAKKPKGEVATFAAENVPATGWLPPELRTAHYDGPGANT